ncbi:TPA: Ig-like domain-containing protein [Yersinia enterocolitica]
MARLPPPYLPQAIQGNLICHTEVETLPGVAVIIRPYELAARGDFIRLYWNHTFVTEKIISSDDISLSLPWVYTISQDRVNAGENTINYTATDAFGNFNESDSVKVYILQNCEATLPPPTFSDAVDGIISGNSIINNRGTHIAVPAYSSITVGDRVTIIFDGYTLDGNLVPNTHYSVQHVIEATDITNGFSILVPQDYLIQIANGEARTSYHLIRADSENIEYSDTTSAIVMAYSLLLPMPVYDDAIDGLLDLKAITGGINVSVMLSPIIDIELGDSVTLNWHGYDYYGQLINGTMGSSIHTTVSITDIVSGALHFVISSGIIEFANIIYLRCEYRVTNPTTSKYRLSYPANALIDIRGLTLPAPIFPYAVNNILTRESINTHNGTLLQASYPGMMVGDTLYFIVDGVDAAGHTIQATSYTATVTVNAAQASANMVDTLIPATNLLAVNNNGVITARYNARFANAPGGFAKSLPNSIELNLNIVPTLILTAEILVNHAGADGINRNYIFYTLKDSFNNPVEGVYLRFSVDRPGVTLDSTNAPTTAAGQYVLGITGTLSGPVTVRAEILSDSSVFAVSSLIFTDKGVELIAEILADNAQANGIAINRVLFTLKETLTGIRIPNVYLHIESSNDAIPASVVQKTDLNGYVELMLTNTTPGNVWIDARSLSPVVTTTKVVSFI